MQCFWEIVLSFDTEHRARLLAFSIGCPNPPALGYERLPGFNGSTAQFLLVGTDAAVDYLPIANTCFAKLKFPCYRDANKLRAKLLMT